MSTPDASVCVGRLRRVRVVKEHHVAERLTVCPECINCTIWFPTTLPWSPVVIVKHNAWLFCAFLSPGGNFFWQVCRHLTSWYLVPQKDLIPGLDHLHHILPTDLCFHRSSCPGGFGDMRHFVDAVWLLTKIYDDVCVGVEPRHRVAWVCLSVMLA